MTHAHATGLGRIKSADLVNHSRSTHQYQSMCTVYGLNAHVIPSRAASPMLNRSQDYFVRVSSVGHSVAQVLVGALKTLHIETLKTHSRAPQTAAL